MDSNRAGRYVQQPSGYRALVPGVPPCPSLTIDGTMTDYLTAASVALGRLDGSVVTVPNPDLFVYMYIRKEAVFANRRNAKLALRIFSRSRHI